MFEQGPTGSVKNWSSRERRKSVAGRRTIWNKSLQWWEGTMRSSESWRKGQKDGPGQTMKGHIPWAKKLIASLKLLVLKL